MAWYDTSGNASDIVSAVCNTITLAVTVYIALKANNFLKSKIHEEGFKRGAEILDEIDKLHDLSLPIISRYNSLSLDYEIAFSNNNHLNLSRDSVLERYNNLLDDVRNLKITIFRIEILLKRLKRWGVVIKHETMIDDVLSSARRYLHSIHALTEQHLAVFWDFIMEYAETTSDESKEAEKNMSFIIMTLI